jgi:hypothetical protein
MCRRASIATVRRDLLTAGLAATRGKASWSWPGPQPVTTPGRSAGLVSADRLWRVDDVGYLP